MEVDSPPGDGLRSVGLASSGCALLPLDLRRYLSNPFRPALLVDLGVRSGKETSDPESLSPALLFLLIILYRLCRSEGATFGALPSISADAGEDVVAKDLKIWQKILLCTCWHGSAVVITVASEGVVSP